MARILIGIAIGIALGAALYVGAAESSSPPRPPGLYYYDGNRVIDVGAHDVMIGSLIERVNRIDRDFYSHKLTQEFRTARLEVIVRKVHPGEDGFTGPLQPGAGP